MKPAPFPFEARVSTQEDAREAASRQAGASKASDTTGTSSPALRSGRTNVGRSADRCSGRRPASPGLWERSLAQHFVEGRIAVRTDAPPERVNPNERPALAVAMLALNAGRVENSRTYDAAETTELLAVCNLILSLHAAGKLPEGHAE